MLFKKEQNTGGEKRTFYLSDLLFDPCTERRGHRTLVHYEHQFICYLDKSYVEL